MARVCELTGKGPMYGNLVSHANNKTKRTFLPNLQNVTLMSEALERVGMANAVLVRRLEDGRHMIIDGHCRAEMMGAEMVPALVLDVSESEARELLATLDPMAELAEMDKEVKVNEAAVEVERAAVNASTAAKVSIGVFMTKTKVEEMTY